MGNKTGCGDAKKNTRHATGLFPDMNCLPHFTIALRRRFTAAADRPAGTREALPGTICGTCVPRFKHKGTTYCAPTKKNGWRAIPPHAQKIDTALAVGKHLLDAGHVCFVHQCELLQLAHAAGRFSAHQVALSGMPALNLAVGGKLEALPGAAVGLQFQFWFRCVPWHSWKSSRKFIAPLAAAGGASPASHKMFLLALLPSHGSQERFLTPLRSVRNDGGCVRCGPLRPLATDYCDGVRCGAPRLLTTAYWACWALDDCWLAGLATLTPFFGANNATRTLPSMRGMVSIWPWSPISMSKRFILARPTSWWAISRPR